MDCRICLCKCEKTEPQYQSLCRTCGQKREIYVAAIVSDGDYLDEDRIDRVFKLAEMIVKRDRLPL